MILLSSSGIAVNRCCFALGTILGLSLSTIITVRAISLLVLRRLRPCSAYLKVPRQLNEVQVADYLAGIFEDKATHILSKYSAVAAGPQRNG